jgi:hypothetical protein
MAPASMLHSLAALSVGQVDKNVPLIKSQPKRPTMPPESALSLTNLPPELLEKIVADAVLRSPDPCQTEDICASFPYLCQYEQPFYDLLNKRLGWYGPYGSMEEVWEKRLSLNHNVWRDEISLKFESRKRWHRVRDEQRSLRYQSSKAWFFFCCGLYKTYERFYWDFYGADNAGWIRHHKSMPRDGQWILDAIAKSYNVYVKVADELEEYIDSYVKHILDWLDQFAPDTPPYETDVAYAVGIYADPSKFEKLLESDARLEVLRTAMTTKPTDKWAEENMPMGLYTIIHNSKELVELLRTHPPAEIEKNFSGTIETLFLEASLADTADPWFGSINGVKIAFSELSFFYERPEFTLDMMTGLLTTWLHIPALRKYVFDKSFQPWGQFRLRTEKEKGVGIKVYGDDDYLATSDSNYDSDSSGTTD